MDITGRSCMLINSGIWRVKAFPIICMVISKLLSRITEVLLNFFLLDVLADGDHEEPLTSELRQDEPKTDLIPAGGAYILPFGRPS